MQLFIEKASSGSPYRWENGNRTSFGAVLPDEASLACSPGKRRPAQFNNFIPKLSSMMPPLIGHTKQVGGRPIVRTRCFGHHGGHASAKGIRIKDELDLHTTRPRNGSKKRSDITSAHPRPGLPLGRPNCPCLSTSTAGCRPQAGTPPSANALSRAMT